MDAGRFHAVRACATALPWRSRSDWIPERLRPLFRAGVFLFRSARPTAMRGAGFVMRQNRLRGGIGQHVQCAYVDRPRPVASGVNDPGSDLHLRLRARRRRHATTGRAAAAERHQQAKR